MIVSDVLNKVLKNISREDVLKTSLFTENGSTPTDEQQELVAELIDCLNDTIESVVYVYHPLKMKETIQVFDNQLNFLQFSKTLIDVVSIKDKNGIAVPFVVFPNYIECQSGTFDVVYTYLPDVVLTLSDEIEFPQGKITARILATGVTSKFFLKRGMFQDANVWDVSFQRLLLVEQRPKHMPNLASRGWIWCFTVTFCQQMIKQH